MLPWILFLAQVQAAAADVSPKRPVEIQALVDRARSLPPEFSADLQLRLAGSRLITEAKWKRELIEDALLAAGRAPHPYRQRSLGTSDARHSQEAAPNDLEALTLQMGAIQAMLVLDPKRALALFESIPTLEPANVPCKVGVTPKVDLYYETAAKIFEVSFTAAQREKGDDLHFLKQRVAQMRSPAQAGPILRMTLAAKIADAQRKELSTAFAVSLDRLSGSDRVFRATEYDIFQATAQPWVDRSLLIPAMRSYIVRQVSGARCADHIDAKMPPPSVRTFNMLVGVIDPGGAQYKPITPEESKPAKTEGTFEEHRYWQSVRSKQVLDGLKWLNHGNRDLPGDTRFLTDEERKSLE